MPLTQQPIIITHSSYNSAQNISWNYFQLKWYSSGICKLEIVYDIVGCWSVRWYHIRSLSMHRIRNRDQLSQWEGCWDVYLHIVVGAQLMNASNFMCNECASPSIQAFWMWQRALLKCILVGSHKHNTNRPKFKNAIQPSTCSFYDKDLISIEMLSL